jgi:hypothetical protein
MARPRRHARSRELTGQRTRLRVVGEPAAGPRLPLSRDARRAKRRRKSLIVVGLLALGWLVATIIVLVATVRDFDWYRFVALLTCTTGLGVHVISWWEHDQD